MNKPVTEKVFKFEYVGLGKGPYSYAGVWTAPSKSLQELNPTAYNNAWKDAPKVSKGYSISVCAHCGAGISECWLVRSGDGLLFAVGSGCVKKVGQKILNMDKEIRAHKNKKAQERRNRIANELKAQIQALLDDPKFGDHIRSQPHHYDNTKTRMDYIVAGLHFSSLLKGTLYQLKKEKEKFETGKVVYD